MFINWLLLKALFCTNLILSIDQNQHLQLCTARTALSDSVIRSANRLKLGQEYSQNRINKVKNRSAAVR